MSAFRLQVADLGDLWNRCNRHISSPSLSSMSSGSDADLAALPSALPFERLVLPAAVRPEVSRSPVDFTFSWPWSSFLRHCQCFRAMESHADHPQSMSPNEAALRALPWNDDLFGVCFSVPEMGTTNEPKAKRPRHHELRVGNENALNLALRVRRHPTALRPGVSRSLKERRGGLAVPLRCRWAPSKRPKEKRMRS